MNHGRSQPEMPVFPKLSAEECRRVHATSLKILKDVGIRLELEEAVDLLRSAGGEVRDNGHVCVPSGLVEEALSTVPKTVTLFDRKGTPKMAVGSHRCFYGTGSDCLNLLDHRTGKRRKPHSVDLIEAVTLCDALPEVDFVMSMVLPSDVDATTADRVQMEALLSNTTKPIVFVAYEFEGCLDCVKMAEVVAGSAENLQKKPFVACYINAVSGLIHNKDALQKLLYLSTKKIPALYIPSSTGGVTSPVTPAGSLAFDYAGVLVGLVLSQLKKKGAPVIIPGMPPGQLDMRTMVSTYSEPERGHGQSMAHFYGLPMFSLGGATESKVADQQAAAEAALTLLVETLAGGNLIHDLGYLESGLTFSFSQLVTCAEIVSWIQGFQKPIDVSDEALAFDVVSEVGPNGQFLNTNHTLAHFRDRWYPRLFERADYKSWLQKGGKNLGERATERVKYLLSRHRPEPLPDKVQAELKSLRRRAEKA